MSLQKSELEYEVSIRGQTPSLTVQDLRKQISKLGPLFPSEDILESGLSISDDLRGVSDALGRVSHNLDSRPDRNVLLRMQNLLNHLHHRLNRIVYDATTKPMYDVCFKEFESLKERFNAVKATVIRNVLPPPIAEPVASTSPLNINVTCDRSNSNELCKIKFDGKSCVRSFIQRIAEFCEARSISDTRILSYATEIFIGDALQWYRNVKDRVSGWVELTVLLREDFGQEDYDYRLRDEICSRTQGETENITVYLSIMASLFSRLSKSLTEDEKLEIILHNIRPCYISTLASVPKITDIDTLRTLCRNYENIQGRLSNFREPPGLTADTLAPEFAYAGSNRNNNFNKNNNFRVNNNNQNKFYQYNNNSKSHQYHTNQSNSKSYSSNDQNKVDINRKYVHAVVAPSEKTLYCPRCRNNTHNLRQCKANKNEVFCFVCGEKDVKTPDCPNCKRNKPSISKN